MARNLKAVFRTLLGTLLLAAFWFAVGWGWASLRLGMVLAVASGIAGPLLLPPFFWLYFRFRRAGSLQRLNIRPDQVLSGAYLRCLLRRPGPKPRVWILFSREPLCFWFERSIWGGGRQILVLSSAWLALDPKQKERDWDFIWDRIAELSPFARRWRSVQLALWMGALLPAELLVLLLHALVRLAGFREMPAPAFWLQRLAWSLRLAWSSLSPEKSLELPSHTDVVVQGPRAWNSIMWGPWILVPRQRTHPLWPFLAHSDGFLTE